jgi:hypothetical protein
MNRASPNKIKLIVDLPIASKHNCKKGNVYKITKIHTEKGSSRTHKVAFKADSGETCCALLGEFEWVYDKE